MLQESVSHYLNWMLTLMGPLWFHIELFAVLCINGRLKINVSCGNGLFVLASEAQPLSLKWFYTKLTVSFCSPTRAADYHALKIASRMKTCRWCSSMILCANIQEVLDSRKVCSSDYRHKYQ